MEGQGKQNKTKQNPLFVLRAIEPERCQMFGECSTTKRTVRETGPARPARRQDFPRITCGGETPLPEVPHGRILPQAVGDIPDRAGAPCGLPGQSSRPSGGKQLPRCFQAELAVLQLLSLSEPQFCICKVSIATPRF